MWVRVNTDDRIGLQRLGPLLQLGKGMLLALLERPYSHLRCLFLPFSERFHRLCAQGDFTDHQLKIE
jgi:hypothetical protein